MPIHGFELIRRENIPGFPGRVELFSHIKTGAELLSLINEDENKTFGITFRTPPSDLTGVFHILEHCVLSGSRKYPVKSPFKELLKSSLQSFMNAYTSADSTIFTGVSQNLQDFYNILEVFLDSVFYPLLTPETFQIEGWHYEWEEPGKSLTYKGVVHSEMTGYYASPEALLSQYTRQSLFPETPYRFNSGGDPQEIPNLTYRQLRDFHRRFYHPSNARIYFYGDDDPLERLRVINEYLRDFDRQGPDTEIPLQAPFKQPRRCNYFFPAGNAVKSAPQSIVTVSWLLGKPTDWKKSLAFIILDYILVGMQGAPLRKALLDSNLGESLVGDSFNADLRQTYFSIGLKGVAPDGAASVEAIILDTLRKLSREGLPLDAIEAAVNHIEFKFREPTTRPFPQSVQLMLRTLTTWLSGADPIKPLFFKTALAEIKAKIRRKKPLFEGMIQRFFLENRHRVTLIMNPDPGLAARYERAEKERLASARTALDRQEPGEIASAAKKLKELQAAPDPPELLAAVPRLCKAHLDRMHKVSPMTPLKLKGLQILYHNFFTNDIVYLTPGFNLQVLPQEYLPYARLFARALLEMGTETEDYETFTRHMNRVSGGIRPSFFNSCRREAKESASWLFLHGKVLTGQSHEILDIFRSILLTGRLDQRERFRQMLLEEKGRQERRIILFGHQIVQTRLSAYFSEACWAGEQMSGVSYLLFLKELIRKVDTDWSGVYRILEEIRGLLINRNAMLLNIAADEAGWKRIQRQLNAFIDCLPDAAVNLHRWHPGNVPGPEGLVISNPVNFVGKAIRLYPPGGNFHGSAFVISRYLKTTWLWEKLRMMHGAYEGYCYFDRLSGVFSLVSVRDPHITKTIALFDQAGNFLKNLDLTEDELTSNIIGTMGEIYREKVPEEKGNTSMMRYLTGVTEAERQQIHEEILSTTVRHFKDFGEALHSFPGSGIIKVLASETALGKAANEGMTGLGPLNVL